MIAQVRETAKRSIRIPLRWARSLKNRVLPSAPQARFTPSLLNYLLQRPQIFAAWTRLRMLRFRVRFWLRHGVGKDCAVIAGNGTSIHSQMAGKVIPHNL